MEPRDHHWNHWMSSLYVSSWVCLLCHVTREKKVNGRMNKWGSGGLDSRRVRMSVFFQQVTASSHRARRNCMHTNVRDRAPARNTCCVHGGTREEHPKGHESRAHPAGREQSTPRPPQPQATTHIEQLNMQEMVAYKPADSCVAA